jgi:opacity protein-like surface antigen
MATAAAVLLYPGQPGAGELEFTPSITVSQSYTDNIDLEPDDAKESALVSEISPSIRQRSQSARSQSALDTALTFRHQTAGDEEGWGTDLDLTGLGRIEAIEEHLFIDGLASISQQVLDNDQAATTGNEETVQVYAVSPAWKNRLGSYANMETRYILGQVLIGGDGDAASDATIHLGRVELDSGRRFARLKGGLLGVAGLENRTDDDDVTRANAGFAAEYAVARTFSLIAGAGYEHFDDGNSDNSFDGPTYMAGFRARPGPRTELEFTYGFTATYKESLGTSQGRLSENLFEIDVDSDTGDFINSPSGFEFNARPNRFDIDNETTRVKAVTARVDGQRGRNTFRVIGSFEREEIEDSGDQEDIYTTSASIARLLTPDLSANGIVAYEVIEFADGKDDKELTLSAGMSYNLYTNMQATLFYSFRNQNSNEEASEFTENRVTVGLRTSF